MFYYYGAIPKGIAKDFITINQHLARSNDQPNNDATFLSPLIACWKYHQTCFSSLESVQTSPQGKLVRLFFYKLEQQMNPISFQLNLLDEEERPINRFDSFYLPQLLARCVYYLYNHEQVAVASDREDGELLNNDSSFEDVAQQCGRIVELLTMGLDHVKGTAGFEECIRKLGILIVNKEWSSELKQAVLLIYLSCLCDRYLDSSNKEEYPLITYRNELMRLLAVQIEFPKSVEFISNDHYKTFQLSDSPFDIEKLLEQYNTDADELENQLVAHTQYLHYENSVFPPRLRQLSFPFSHQKPFGDCQELNMFEIFINNFLFNHDTKKYDLSLLPNNSKLDEEISDLLKEFNFDAKFVNSLSLRGRYHRILQGKPHIFQYVNTNVLSDPSKDYEVDVTAFNMLSYAEWIFGLKLEKLTPIKKFLDFESYLKLRESKEENSPISFEEVTILKQARLRFCLEKGFKKEKKQLELAFKELSTQLSTPSRTVEVKFDRTTKQNHNLIIFKYMFNDGKCLKYQITADQYGAHVATYRINL